MTRPMTVLKIAKAMWQVALVVASLLVIIFAADTLRFGVKDIF